MYRSHAKTERNPDDQNYLSLTVVIGITRVYYGVKLSIDCCHRYYSCIL